MLYFLIIIGFLWLMLKGIGLAFRLTWGITKILGSLAVPLLILCLIMWGGGWLLIPVLLVVFGIWKIGK